MTMMPNNVEALDQAPAPTQDIRQGKENLDRYGFTIHENLLTPAQVETLRADLLEQAEMEREQGVATYRLSERMGNAIADRRLGRPPEHAHICWQAVLTLPNKGHSFIDLACHPVVAEYGRHILKETPCYLTLSVGLLVRKGSGGQIVHIDQQPVPFQTPIPLYYHAMVALSDFEAEMGATCVVPGSHLSGRAPEIVFNMETMKGESREDVSDVAIPAVCRAGSAIVFESRLWHFQGESTSDKTRLSILNGYSMHFMRGYDDYVASLHDDVYSTLTKEEKVMLGFEVVSEYTGRYHPRAPGDRRCNTNARYPYIPELRRKGHRSAEPFEGMGSNEH